MKSAKNYDDTTVPPLTGTLEDAVRAMLATLPPPAGHPSTARLSRRRPRSAERGSESQFCKEGDRWRG